MTRYELIQKLTVEQMAECLVEISLMMQSNKFKKNIRQDLINEFVNMLGEDMKT